MKTVAITVAALGLGLAACDADVSATHDANRDKVAIEGAADGQVKFDLPFAKGTVKLPADMMKDANFDIDGVKMYPGATIKGFSVDAGAKDGATVDMRFEAPATPDAVRGYFLEQFKAKGVTAQATANGIEGQGKEGDRFAMTFAPGAGGTVGTVAIRSQRS